MTRCTKWVLTRDEAPTLDVLTEMLNAAEAYHHQCRMCQDCGENDDVHGCRPAPTVEDVYDLTCLPVYGEHHPSDRTGLYSWDDTRVLLRDGLPSRPWRIVETGDFHA
jgi:hypothetical protein